MNDPLGKAHAEVYNLSAQFWHPGERVPTVRLGILLMVGNHTIQIVASIQPGAALKSNRLVHKYAADVL